LGELVRIKQMLRKERAARYMSLEIELYVCGKVNT